MAYDKVDPAAWWKDAEPVPPKTDEPGVAVDPSPLPPLRSVSSAMVVGSSGNAATCPPWQSGTLVPIPGGYRVVQRRDPAPWQIRPALPLPEVRVGDRLLGDDGVVSTVDHLPDPAWINAVTAGGGHHGIPAGCVGPPGSGKPWTLLPRETPRLPSASRPLIATARVDAAHDVLRARAVGPVSWNAVREAVRAADAADLCREVLERVARAAQDARTGRTGSMGTAFVEMCAALDALAALDGEGGP